MQTNYIKDLLNFKDVEVKKIKNLENSVEVYVELPKSTQFCPRCAFETSKVHDSYTHFIQDVPIQLKTSLLLILKKLKLLLTIFIGFAMLVMLLIKLELKFKIICLKKKEFILSTPEDYFFLDTAI